MAQALPGGSAGSAYLRSFGRKSLAILAGALLSVGTVSILPASADPGHEGVIKGYVYADAGNDGYYDVDEAPIADIKISLESGGVKIGSVRTDEAGQFAFEGLAPGTYQVLEHQSEQFRDGVEVAGIGGTLIDNDQIEVTLAAGAVSSGHLFAEIPAEPGVSNPDFPVAVAGQVLILDPLANDGVLDEASRFDPDTVRLLDPETGKAVTELVVPGEAHYRVLEDGRVEIRPESGFLGWATEIGYQAATTDYRRSASVIGVEVRERLSGLISGREILPS